MLYPPWELGEKHVLVDANKLFEKIACIHVNLQIYFNLPKQEITTFIFFI